MDLIEFISQKLFPEACLACRRRGSFLCLNCLAKATPAEEKIPGIISFFSYKNEIVKKSIWHLKYRNKKSVALVFARVIADRLWPEISDLAIFENFDNPIFVPIPISRNRLRKRNYNQAEVITCELARLTGLSATSALEKIKETPTQVSVHDRTTRIVNLQGAFAVPYPQAVLGRNIFVVDDIATTGATIEEARRALRAAGAKKVLGLTLAH